MNNCRGVLFAILLVWLGIGAVFSQEFASLEKTQSQSNEDALDMRISLDFKNIDIVEALKFISKKSGMNIIPTKDVQGRITLSVEDAILRDIFNIMLRSHGLAYDKRGDIYNVMTNEEYKTLYGKSFSDMSEVRIFHLRYAIPEHVFSLCDTLKSDIGKVILDSESGSILVMDTPQKIEQMQKVIDSLEHKTTVLEVFDLKYANAKDVTNQLKTHLDIKKVGSIHADERSNQVIVQTLPARIKDIKKLIANLDRKTREVLMDVKVVKVKATNTFERGVEWEGLFDIGRQFGLTYLGSYPFSAVQSATDSWRSRQEVYEDTGNVGSYPFSGTTTDISSGTKSAGLEKLHVGIVGKHDFDVLFKYFLDIGETKVVANPKIAVIENQEAKIHIGEKQAYITNTTTQTTSTTTVAEEVTFVDVGIQIYLTPMINEDGFITVKVKPEISSVLSYLITGENNKIPILNTSTVETTVMVQDGSTILIGGLQQDSQSETAKEVPFIRKIPILGALLGSRSTTDERSDFLIMVTPHVIQGDELTTGYAHDFGHRLDKEDQNYPDFTSESIGLTPKSYQEYDVVIGEKERQAKPMQ